MKQDAQNANAVGIKNWVAKTKDRDRSFFLWLYGADLWPTKGCNSVVHDEWTNPSFKSTCLIDSQLTQRAACRSYSGTALPGQGWSTSPGPWCWRVNLRDSSLRRLVGRTLWALLPGGIWAISVIITKLESLSFFVYGSLNIAARLNKRIFLITDAEYHAILCGW